MGLFSRVVVMPKISGDCEGDFYVENATMPLIQCYAQ